MMGMIPLLIIVIIVIGILVFSTRTRNKMVHKKGKFSYSQRVYWLLSGYVVILLICLILNAVQPVKIMDGLKKVNTADLERESLNLYDAAVEGSINQEGSKFLRKKWNFNYQGQQLNLAVIQDENIDAMVVVEKKNNNDGKIEAEFYQTRSSYNGMDITELANLPGMELAGDQLTLLNPKRSEIKFSQFGNTFNIKQFTGEPSLFSEHHSEFSGGQRIIYLRIPKDLELNYPENLNLQFVE
ncbi:hypothetical protein BACCIP111895_02985 [Neobacillus rhizosphaerae]|uniref:DUF4352 domain-containing protein n=1 Tax=Neobacillus rhizosphaerae TaxID=2880965 RepID=A0ABM9ET20_9BACI|nr:hypothetical protein [Neobacillus rhizosphaerae]CAH2715801.1 hypothetical protein BACCIP111895_02985 [Neobacillus rhizosphaerae]